MSTGTLTLKDIKEAVRAFKKNDTFNREHLIMHRTMKEYCAQEGMHLDRYCGFFKYL